MAFEVAFHGLLGHHKATADFVADHLLDDAVGGSLRDAKAIGHLIDGEHAGHDDRTFPRHSQLMLFRAGIGKCSTFRRGRRERGDATATLGSAFSMGAL